MTGVNGMQSALHFKTTVLPGQRVEISAPELKEGDPVDVFVVLPETTESQRPRKSMLELIQSFPPGPRAFKTWEEFEEHFQAERNSWER